LAVPADLNCNIISIHDAPRMSLENKCQLQTMSNDQTPMFPRIPF
jgi:hypothetical protein